MTGDRLWGDASEEEQLKAAFAEFDAWTKTHRIPHSQPAFKLSNMDRYPLFQCKAYNGRVVVAWMANKSVQHMQTEVQWHLASWFNISEKCDRYLTIEEASRLQRACVSWLRSGFWCGWFESLIGMLLTLQLRIALWMPTYSWRTKP
ncbi:unnamed protein product [Symbiodinium sp. CCMP2592]|nr:unnamed protein product [Symbiodinium sp. CCMP2592]